MNNKFTYTKVGDVYLPNLVYGGTNYPIGKWGRMHRNYMREYHSAIYTSLLTSCKLNEYLHNIDIQATQQFETIVEQMKQQQSVTEQLKSTDQLAWVQAMNNITHQAQEIILNDIVYKY